MTRRELLAALAGLAAGALAGCSPRDSRNAIESHPPTVTGARTASPTPSPTAIMTRTATQVSYPSPTGTQTSTVLPSQEPEPTRTSTATPSSTLRSTPTSSTAPSPTPETRPTETLIPSATPEPDPTNTAVPSSTPETKPTATPVASAPPEPKPTDTAMPSPTSGPKALVALASCPTYARDAVEARLRDMVGALGGLGNIVKPGATVVIKTNLTGGVNAGSVEGRPRSETFWTHPEVVRAICTLCREAGSGRIVVAEGWGLETLSLEGYGDLIGELGVEAIDLDIPDPFGGFVEATVGEGWETHERLYMHRILAEADVLVSVAKLKCHASAGVTLALKNLFGCVPLGKYKVNPSDSARSALHSGDWHTRLPRIVVDIAQALPIHFSVIDGVLSQDAGEGPWNASQSGDLLRANSPGVLIAGEDPVAVDAVATSVMGFDPTAARGESAFLNSDNHIVLAGERGLGVHRLDQVGIVGESIETVRYPFHAVPKQV